MIIRNSINVLSEDVKSTQTDYRQNIMVEPNMSLSPADMMDLVDKGIPVSTPNANLFYDGTDSPSWDVPIERKRGVDIADINMAQASARSKVITAHKSDTNKYD